jgi:hypothetical protein
MKKNMAESHSSSNKKLAFMNSNLTKKKPSQPSKPNLQKVNTEAGGLIKKVRICLKIEKDKSRRKEDSFFKIIENECFKIAPEKVIHKKIIKTAGVVCCGEKAENRSQETKGVQKPGQYE